LGRELLERGEACTLSLAADTNAQDYSEDGQNHDTSRSAYIKGTHHQHWKNWDLAAKGNSPPTMTPILGLLPELVLVESEPEPVAVRVEGREPERLLVRVPVPKVAVLNGLAVVSGSPRIPHHR
jgi:hypothetical protein